MTNAENSSIESGRLEEKQRLSPKMKASWDTGDFWLIYGARKNFAFDAIFWQELDPRFFGEPGVSQKDAWTNRLDLMDGPDKAGMKAFVEKKMKDRETRVLAWEADE